MRKQRILQALQRLAPPGAPSGATADAIGQAAGVLRHNASADLNELCREGLVRKLHGRPVRFWATADAVQHPASASDSAGEAAAPGRQSVTPAPGLESLVGAEGSLRAAVEQARAAMLYPPRGLPTLIVGPTGSGKSRLADAMYHYARDAGRLDSGAPFSVFNCADYAANPQLLLSQLFGHGKGAFTGADRESPGLIAETEGGVLFLDEIHRLPPDGQEMLFLLMDRGVYRCLGGSMLRRANVTLIAATSEDPHSALLHTFLRRFPAMITLPDLNQRPLEERLAMVDFFLREEAARVGMPISASPLALVALLCFRTAGNVGELRSTVLLGCARAFLNYMASGATAGVMTFYLTHLSPQIQLTYLSAGDHVHEAESLVGVDDRLYLPPPDGQATGGRRDDYVPLDLYSELRGRMNGYLESSLQPWEVQQLIRTDLDYYLRGLLRRADSGSHLSARLLQVATAFVTEAAQELGRTFGQAVVTGLALHLASSPRADYYDAQQALALVAHCPREYGVVRRLSHHLEEGLGMAMTPGEVTFLALFLASHGRTAESRELAVLVVAHGERTASSMAAVANRLVGARRALAVDMPLDQSVEETLQMAILRLREAGAASGALLLVDMGSLTAFGPAIAQATGIPVAVIPLVTTAAVIEAARMAGEPNCDLAGMVHAVRQVYSPDSSEPIQTHGKRVIITTCLTGQGTARKLAAFLEEALPPRVREIVSVQPVDLDRGSPLPGLLVEGWRGSVIAAAGTVDPRLPGVTFIGMEQILFGDGLHTLVSLAVGQEPAVENAQNLDRAQAVALASRFVADSMDSMDGQEAAGAAVEALEGLEARMEQMVSPSQAARWTIHCAFTLERLVDGGPIISCSEQAFLQEHHGRLLELIRDVLAPVERQWHVDFPAGEIGFLALIILS